MILGDDLEILQSRFHCAVCVYAIWLDGEALTHDYVPCLDAANKPAFYDRVAGDYLYPLGDKAVYQAEFEANADAGSVSTNGG